jgi:GNAT superfamily N-acetyltransferase
MLLRQLGESLELPADRGEVDLPAVWKAMAAHPDMYANLVAEEGRGLVGFVSMICYRTLLHPGGTALINELVVAEHRRRQGIGRSLLTAAVELARSRGMNEVEVGVERANHGALGFYRGQAFALEYVLLGRDLAADSPGAETRPVKPQRQHHGGGHGER